MAAVGPQILPASATNYRLIWLLSKILSAVSANVLNVKSTFTHKLNASIWERDHGEASAIYWQTCPGCEELVIILKKSTNANDLLHNVILQTNHI